MWMAFAVGSAFFAGVTAVLAKLGIRDVDANLATALRAGVVLVLAWGLVFLVGSQTTLGTIDGHTWVFLILSGLATGASWLCYFRALQDGPASVVVPIDKLSILVSVAAGVVVFRERVSMRGWVGLSLVVAGTLALLA